jgi:hypothetical protein
MLRAVMSGKCPELELFLASNMDLPPELNSGI